MALTLEALLDGPRGRRLLLEFALASEQRTDPSSAELSGLVHAAARVLEPQGEHRGQLMSRWAVFGSPVRVLSPAVGPAEVARALDATDLAEPSEDLLRLVLADVVAFARYWQEPEGEDLLAGSAELRGALLRVARHLLGSPQTQWWSQDVRLSDQACVQWPDIPGYDHSGEPTQVLSDWRAEQQGLELRALRDRPEDPKASYGGVWWSRPPDHLLRSTARFSDHAPAVLYLFEDDFGWETAHTRRLWVSGAPRVCEIRSAQDWAALCERFPLEVSAEKRHDWYRTTGRAGRWVIPDWEAASKEYDGVHLSVAGYLSSAGRAIPVGADTASVIAGWNPGESWWFTSETILGSEVTHWQLDEESLHWRKVSSCAGDELPPAG
ncbi:hypothetical protein ACHABX_10230 [Nesterenkonia halotolerans]|uniref:hypothetical protein n=1 Tax=Nesterenkonia halotolerans TaxID=225325 RepID=UPI003EE488DD